VASVIILIHRFPQSFLDEIEKMIQTVMVHLTWQKLFQSRGTVMAVPLMGDNRYTLRRANPYHTRRNRVAPVRTPGNKLVAQYLVKRAKGPRCGETGKPLAGIPHLTTQKLKRLHKTARTVARPYGGVLSGPVVRDRIINAFMEEEARAAAEKKAQTEKKDSKKKGK
jgi:large subunit ribosomal protein L34e